MSPSLARIARTSLAIAGLALCPPPQAQSQYIGGQYTQVDEYVAADVYQMLDTVEGAWVNLNIAPVRPLTRRPGTNVLFAVNTNNDTVEKFDGSSTDDGPTDVFHTPWGPVSIVYWERAEEDDELLVVCRGSYVFLRMDPVTGDILHMLEMRDPTTGIVQAEPGDVLLDDDAEDPRVFVSCSGSDSVVQIDLTTNSITRVYNEASHSAFRLKNPLFLAADGSGGVLVAPMISGNNSVAEPGGVIDALEQVIDLDSDTNNDLPDEDLFRILPDTGANGTVEVVAEATGAVLFGIEKNPSTGAFWQLNTEANNSDDLGCDPCDNQTEPDVRGRFVENRISVVTPSTSPVPDDGTDTGDHTIKTFESDYSTAMGQPYALAFRTSTPNAGGGYVVGPLTNKLVLIDSTGSSKVGEWPLKAGSIPRGVVLDNTESNAFVYCWGNGAIAKVDVLGSTTTHYYFFEHDPTPEIVADGRRSFYDGTNSEDGNASCASCHIDGRSDMLVWNLSAGPGDNKGPMLTQTLAGIEKLTPFHWRGERRLIDFNPAFAGLLGGSPLSTTVDEEKGYSPFDAFEAFVFSIQNPANPNQNKSRRLDHTIDAGVTGSPYTGQVEFFSEDTFRNKFKCNDCHMLPTGTINDTFADSDDTRARRSFRKVAPFHELWRRAQSSVMLDLVDPGASSSEPYAFLGASLSHAGLFPDLLAFVTAVNGTMTSEAQNITNFLFQIDQGLAPAVHRAFLIDPSTASGDEYDEVEDFLLPQAMPDPYRDDLRNCSIAVFGEVMVGSTPTSVRWRFDPDTEEFESDTSGVGPEPLSYFKTQALTHGLSNVFVGLPVGMDDRYGVDFDMDTVLNGNDSSPFTPDSLTDTTGPAFVEGPTVRWISGRVARFSWVTDEPATFVIRNENDVYGNGENVSYVFSKTASGLATDMRPSTPDEPSDPTITSVDPIWMVHDVYIDVYDRNGNMTTADFDEDDAITTAPFLRDKGNNQFQELAQTVVVDSIVWTEASSDEEEIGGETFVTITAEAEIEVRYKMDEEVQADRLADGRVVVATVLALAADGSTRVVNGSDLTADPGASSPETFLVDQVKIVHSGADVFMTGAGESVSGAAYLVGFDTGFACTGKTHLRFEASGLLPTEELVLNIENVIPIVATEASTFRSTTLPAASGGTLEVPAPFTRSDFKRWSFPDSLQPDLIWSESTTSRCDAGI